MIVEAYAPRLVGDSAGERLDAGNVAPHRVSGEYAQRGESEQAECGGDAPGEQSLADVAAGVVAMPVAAIVTAASGARPIVGWRRRPLPAVAGR